MKVFNLTDIETSELRRAGWVRVPIAVGPALIQPGEVAEVEDTEMVRQNIRCFTSKGALAVGVKPPSYMVACSERESNERLAALEKAARERKKK